VTPTPPGPLAGKPHRVTRQTCRPSSPIGGQPGTLIASSDLPYRTLAPMPYLRNTGQQRSTTPWSHGATSLPVASQPSGQQCLLALPTAHRQDYRSYELRAGPDATLHILVTSWVPLLSRSRAAFPTACHTHTTTATAYFRCGIAATHPSSADCMHTVTLEYGINPTSAPSTQRQQYRGIARPLGWQPS
jgi:hypothetical protein